MSLTRIACDSEDAAEHFADVLFGQGIRAAVGRPRADGTTAVDCICSFAKAMKWLGVSQALLRDVAVTK